MRFGRLSGLLVMGACAYLGSIGVAEAVTCTGTNPITCPGGTNGAEVTVTPNLGTASNATNFANNFPATLVIPSGAAPAGSTVSSISLRLNGYTSTTGGGDGASRDVGILLESPDGRILQVISRIGSAASAQTNLTITIADGGANLPAPPSNAWTTSGTFAPGNYSGLSGLDGDRDGEDNPNYSAGGGPSSFHTAAPFGTSTMAGVFNGATVVGTWKVYLADDAGNLNGLGADVKFTSFDLIIGFSAASTPSSTSLSPSLTTSFTSGSNSSVTLTATVNQAGATGAVSFLDGGVSFTCAGGNQSLNSSQQATCTKTFTTEGIHSLTAVYNGDSTFIGSTSNPVNIFVQNHSTNTGTTYCNTGAVSSTGLSNSAYSATTPYPSVIDVGDGINTSIPGSVSTVSVTLKNFSSAGEAGLRMLLVAPDGTHGFDFWDGPGTSIGTGNYTLQDGSTQLAESAPISPGTYGPTAINPTPSLFTPGPPSPAPQVPATYQYAAPVGSATFETAFNGALANGQWSLFLHDANGNSFPANAAGGWCLTISAATGHPTTTTVTSSASPNAALGTSVTFTATVASTPAATIGTVTFTENGAPLVGASPSSAVAVSNGVAAVSTTALPEGDHTITATYHDSTSTFNDSFGTITIRVDKTTATPTLS
ncbi:MAG TPA: Ig-like domain-containing protein, partial [Bryobacteraceae bacterium]